MGDFVPAKRFYNKLLKLENIPVYMLTGISKNYININNLKKAKEILTRAIAIEPQNVEVLYQLGQIYLKEGNLQNARQLVEDAYTLAPNSEVANLLAQIYMAQGEFEPAYGFFNLINLMVPNNTAVLFNMAKCKIGVNDYKTAKEHIDTILSILPEHEDAQNLLKEIEEKVKDN